MRTIMSVAVLLSLFVVDRRLASQTVANPVQSGLPEIPPSIEMRADLVYATPDGKQLRLDLFVPKAMLGPAPAVVFIHGVKDGRDKSHYRRFAASVAARMGLITVSINYRAPLDAPYPAAIEDARAAVAWIKKNAAELGVLPGAVAAAGDGFGGYLAAMLGVATNERGPEVGAVIAIHAVLDLAQFEPVGQPPYAYDFHLFFGYPRAERPQVWEQASPLRYADKRSVPFLFAHVEGQRIPIDQSRAMLRALTSAGVRANLYSPAGAGNSLVDAPHQVPGLVQSVANFVTDVLWRPVDGVRAIKDVVYANRDGRDLRVDLYLPASVVRAPGVLVLHGGGWAWGNKREFRSQAAYLAAHGFVSACFEYRLSRERIYPAALDDAKTAVRWLRANAARYGIDPDKIAAMGISAGGQLASMLGVTPDRRSFERGDDHPGVSSKVQAVVAISATVDMLGKDRVDPTSARTFMGSRPQEAPARWAEASPTNHV